MSSTVATTALAVTGPMAGAVASRATRGSVAASVAMRPSAAAICSFSGASTVNNGCSSASSAGDSDNAPMRWATR